MIGRVPTKELIGRLITPQEEASFWSLVRADITGSDCWEWVGHGSGGGYGRFKINGARYNANRVSYALCYGYVPVDRFVCHHCDNPKCVRPDHLFLGTAGQNSDDRTRKGRTASGERGGGAKLTDAQASAILIDVRPHAKIATDYGVKKSTVGKLKSGKNWKHLHGTAAS